MKRQEFLLNLTLVTVIGALGYSMYDSYQNPPERPEPIEVERTEEDDVTSPRTETIYDERTADAKLPGLRNKDLYAAIITPTPPPPTPTPKPTETPNINTATAKWSVLSIFEGVVTIEDTDMSAKQMEGNVFEMKVGDTRDIDVGKGQMKTLTLKAVDETSNPDMPTATFALQDTDAVRVVPMGNDINAPPPPPAPVPGAAPGAVPGAPAPAAAAPK